MIQNLNDYNPLPAIKAELDRASGQYSTELFDYVRKELFAAGIVFETEDEFTQALELMLIMDII